MCNPILTRSVIDYVTSSKSLSAYINLGNNADNKTQHSELSGWINETTYAICSAQCLAFNRRSIKSAGPLLYMEASFLQLWGSSTRGCFSAGGLCGQRRVVVLNLQRVRRMWAFGGRENAHNDRHLPRKLVALRFLSMSLLEASHSFTQKPYTSMHCIKKNIESPWMIKLEVFMIEF